MGATSHLATVALAARFVVPGLPSFPSLQGEGYHAARQASSGWAFLLNSVSSSFSVIDEDGKGRLTRKSDCFDSHKLITTSCMHDMCSTLGILYYSMAVYVYKQHPAPPSSSNPPEPQVLKMVISTVISMTNSMVERSLPRPPPPRRQAAAAPALTGSGRAPGSGAQSVPAAPSTLSHRGLHPVDPVGQERHIRAMSLASVGSDTCSVVIREEGTYPNCIPDFACRPDEAAESPEAFIKSTRRSSPGASKAAPLIASSPNTASSVYSWVGGAISYMWQGGRRQTDTHQESLLDQSPTRTALNSQRPEVWPQKDIRE